MQSEELSYCKQCGYHSRNEICPYCGSYLAEPDPMDLSHAEAEENKLREKEDE